MGAGQFISFIGRRTGQFLTNLTYVVTTLLGYVFLSILTYLWLAARLSSPGRARFIAYEISTGGDPFNFAAELYQHVWLWRWVLLFHVISWIIVPVLAATAVDATFRLWEQRRLELDRRLMSQMVDIIVEHLGMKDDEAQRLALKTRQRMENMLNGPSDSPREES